MIKRPLAHIILLMLIVISVCAAEKRSVKMTASATSLFVTDVFDLDIVLENFESDVSVEYPDFSGLKTISGPYQSSSTSIINGNVTKSVTLSYRFIPKNTGKLTIGPASVTENGKTYRSNSITIDVLKTGDTSSRPDRDMFIITRISNEAPYIGEMVRIDYTLYVKPGLDISLPSLSEEPKFTGFVKEPVEYSREKQVSLIQTVYKGVKYNTLPVRSYWLKPTFSGKQNIEGITLQVPVAVKSKRRRSLFNDPFFDDDFFSSGFKQHQDKIVVSEELKLNIKPLPDEGKPAGFTGAVGSFRMHASIDNDSVDVNDAVTLRITVSGTGNIKDMIPPKPEIPADFEVYDPKKNFSGDSSSGTATFEYLLLPRVPGEHNIEPVTFSYFDPEKKTYRILEQGPFNVTVNGTSSSGTGNSSPSFSRRDIQLIGRDIRFIKKSADRFYPVSERDFDPKGFLTCLVILMIIPVGAGLLSAYILRSTGDIARQRRKKAVREAVKRLKQANSSIRQDNHIEFYKFLDDAVRKFLADKFNISHAGIISDDISSDLKEKDVPDVTVESLKDILIRSSSVQFAPVKPTVDDMKNDVNLCMKLMEELNEHI